MSELSFLLEILLNHKVPKATKDAIRERIKDIEASIAAPAAPRIKVVPSSRPSEEPEKVTLTNPDGTTSEIDLSKQSPSMRAKILAQQQEAPVPIAQPALVAQTPAAAAALAHRAELIAQATSGREEKGRSSPRKF